MIIISDLYKVSASKLENILTKSFEKFYKKDVVDKHPAVFLKGSPGIGKSQSVYKVGEVLSELTNTKVNIIDIRLILFNPVDLRGIPVANVDERLSIWLKPEIFNLNSTDSQINILFLDELTSAPRSVQAAAYQIALDRKIGEHKLPNNTFVIAAGNKESDNAVTYEMPSALKNRFIHFEVVNDVEDWLDWANKNDINKEIISFINKYPSLLYSDNFNNDKVIVTPRSYEMLSNIIKIMGGNLLDNSDYVKSVLGNELTKLLFNDNNIIMYEDVIYKRYEYIPSNLEELEYITQSLETKVNDYTSDLNKINNILEFINELPVDYGVRIFRLLSRNVDEKIDLSKNNLYKAYIERMSKHA